MFQQSIRRLALAALLLLVTISACGGGGMSPEPSSPTASTGQIPDTSP